MRLSLANQRLSVGDKRKYQKGIFLSKFYEIIGIFLTKKTSYIWQIMRFFSLCSKVFIKSNQNKPEDKQQGEHSSFPVEIVQLLIITFQILLATRKLWKKTESDDCVQ